MKKSTFAVLLVFMIAVIILSGCTATQETENNGETTISGDGSTGAGENTGETQGQEQTEPETGTGTETETETSDEPGLKIGETAATTDTEVTVLSAEFATTYEYIDFREETAVRTAPEGRTFLILQVKVLNAGRETDYVGAGNFTLTTGTARRLNHDIFNNRADEFPQTRKLYKTQEAEGSVIFEISEDASGLKLFYDFGETEEDTSELYWNVS